jgi:tripartite-type tricarboxylate transporter receptor subunit TctC
MTIGNRIGISAIMVLMAIAHSVYAQQWPQRPIRWISPFAPGGGADMTSRAIAAKLSTSLGHQVLVDNRGGAGGMIGVDMGAKSAPDGYTIVLGTIGPMAINPWLYKKMTYDALNDLVPVSKAANALNVLVVHPSLPAKSVKDMIAIAKSRPGQLNYGSSGSGATDHLSGELFNVMAGVKMVHVPYKGGAPAMLDLVSGNVQLVFSTVSTAIGAIESKRIRALGMTGNQRFELMPDIPTIAEAGLKGFEVNNWYGVFLPVATPKEIVNKLSAEVVKAVSAPDLKRRLLEVGIVAIGSTPEEHLAYVKSEHAKWGKVIKDAKISIE